ncbi:MAG: secondary thiamine-phosphate synthase enzyme YjbQ [Clostridia bacterium]|jgi:secondary thiamine-phosphate synthase enzyme|nr:secondary thiamine-phosphate synthase enzyme YjbQ [Clostridia bacterium]
MIYDFSIHSGYQMEFIDITNKIRDQIKKSGIREGLCTVFVPHTTCGVTINQNANPDIKTDFIKTLEHLVPNEELYKAFEVSSPPNIKAALMGFDQTLIIREGELVLGNWQGIFLTEFDGPQIRNIMVKILS